MSTEAGASRAAIPSLAVGPSLKTVAAQEIRMLLLDVAEARHIHDVGASAKNLAILVSWDYGCGSAPFDVVHQVVTQLAGGVGKARRKFRCGGMEQYARGLQRGRAKKNDRLVEFERRACLRINHANARYFARFRIEDQAEVHAHTAPFRHTGIF